MPLTPLPKPVFFGKLIFGLILLAIAVTLFLIVQAPVIFMSEGTRALSRVDRWFCLLEYHEENHPEPIAWGSYQMAILDRDSHPPLEALPENFIPIAYVSFGEAENYRSYWSRIKGASWIVKENKNWKGSYWVDVRSREWQALLLNEVIPQVKAQGFRGIFMDTLDVPIELEHKHPIDFSGSKDALEALVAQIRRRHPDFILVSNNAYEMLPRLAPYLNGVLAEGLNSHIDFEQGGFRLAEVTRRGKKIEVLKHVSRKQALPVFVLDYAPENSAAGAESFRALSEKLGFKPYVAGRKLDRVYPQ